MATGPVLPSPVDSPDPHKEVSGALDGFLNSGVHYVCVQRDVQVSSVRILQAMEDTAYKESLKSTHEIYTGSLYEGMPWKVCGDQDIMGTKRSYPSVLNQSPVTDMDSRTRDGDLCTTPTQDRTHCTTHTQDRTLCTTDKQCRTPCTTHTQDRTLCTTHTQDNAGYVIAECNPDQPAYLRLLAPEGETFQSDDITNSFTEHNGTRYLSSSRFVANTLGEGAEVHGPAGTQLAFSNNPGAGMADMVYCLPSPSWPHSAREFFLRPRSHGWPSQKVLHHIETAGCHVVGASHYSTDRRDLEWRWSWSMAEKELIHSLSKEVAGCMYTLKTLKKELWHEGSDNICSYFLKVACLWIAERTNSDNLTSMSYTRLVLEWLIQSYENCYLPHYFIPTQNLIHHLPQDVCLDMARTLREVQSQLWEHVLHGMDMGSCRDLLDVTKYIQGQLDLTQGVPTTSEGCRQLLTTLLACDREKAVRVLEEATHRVGPGSEVYVSEYHKLVGFWSVSNVEAIQNVLRDHIKVTHPSELVHYPERIGLSVMDTLPHILHQTHVDTFTSALYRLLADTYHCLYLHYRENGTDLPSGVVDVCYQKAELYHTECIYIPYPDGWGDGGLSGYVNLAKFHFLNGEWDKVEDAMAKVQPLLEEVGQLPGTLNGLSHIGIDTRYNLCLLPWSGDRALHCLLVERFPSEIVCINPAVLGYYTQGRLALRRGRREVAEDCVRCMERAREAIVNVRQKESAQRCIDALTKYLA